MLSLVPAAIHLAENHRGVDHLQIDVGLLGRVGADEHQEIASPDLHAVASVIEQRDIGADHGIAEFLQRAVEGGFVEIDLRAVADELKADPLERVRHQLRIVLRIIQSRDVLVGRIADHQRHALLGLRGARDEQAADHKHQPDIPRCQSCPLHATAPPRRMV
jgi:hypothetical protein